MSKDAITLWTGGGLVAAGAVVSALVTNWLGARRERRTHEHEQAMAREARRQERLEQTYIELLTYLSHYGDWARSVQPMWGPVPVPDPMSPQERWRIEALVTAFGSPDVSRLLDQWTLARRRSTRRIT